MKATEIAKHVTHFSEQLKFASQEEEVVVGGKLTNMISPVDDHYPMYVAVLDDAIGTLHVYVSDTMISAYPEQFEVGNYIFLEGFVNIMSHRVKDKTEKEVSVFAYAMKDITILQETNQ
jgi:hypothetical protein